MAAGALPFVIVAAGRAMLILVAVAVRAVVVARLFLLWIYQTGISVT
jgi:hypothetical protein